MHFPICIVMGRLTSRFARAVELVVDGGWCWCLLVDLGIRAWGLI
jgi:hypothetical protein